jgi:hypothetical protein
LADFRHPEHGDSAFTSPASLKTIGTDFFMIGLWVVMAAQFVDIAATAGEIAPFKNGGTPSTEIGEP